MEKSLTAKEAAELFKVDYRHLLKMAKRGDIPAFQIGSSWRFRESWLENWINKQVESASRNHSRRSEERTA